MHMQETNEILKIFIAIFVLINPLAGIPMFIKMTANNTSKEKLAIANKTFLAVLIILIFSQYLGKPLLELFGISIPSFTVSGGIIIFLIALSLIFKEGISADSTKSVNPALVAGDFAVVPLAIPILAGPGVISTVILYGGRTKNIMDTVILTTILIVVAVATWFSLRVSSKIEVFLHETGVNVMMKVSGLIVAAIGVELIVEGIRKMLPYLLPK